MKTLLLAATSAAAFAFGVAAPANAVSVVGTACVSVAHANGCKFSGNINTSDSGNNSYLHAQIAYNAYNDLPGKGAAQPDIVLNPIGSTDPDDDMFISGIFTGTEFNDDNEPTAGTWQLNGFLVDFFAVKSGNKFVLYQVGTPAASGFWSTDQLGGKGMSHITFFGSAGVVPEPATWAMMIGGFGLVGAAMRRRQRASAALA